ncbi:MAG: xanthine dehydrogenase family protein molybdopterin-binding subunit [Ascidiaceihabitans sp.]|nr:xanthine dehydrogenase family protein molybdopterin-binding subunit [Ascidiaceihabitans sp.]
MTMSPPAKPRLIKREDYDLITGRGRFADDVQLDSPLHVAFVRATASEGKIVGLDVSGAIDAPQIHAVHTGADVKTLGVLSLNPVLETSHTLPFEILAQTHVRATGQPVAAVLGTSAQSSADAADLIEVDTEADPTQRLKCVGKQSWQHGSAASIFNAAHLVVSCTIQHPRLAPSPMEPRSISVAYDTKTGCVTVFHSTQTPHRSRSELASILGIDISRIRVVAQHVGGAFGMKASLFPEEVFTVWAAFQHKRDFKWIASRGEDFLAGTHGRGLTTKGWLACDPRGKFLALKAEIEAPIGAWLPNSGLIPAWNAGRILPSGYCIDALDITTCAVQDGRGPTGIYRGAGRPEANMLMERLVDKAARALGQDPFEIRSRNLLRSDAFPHRTATGNTLDSGDYHHAITTLREKSAYTSLMKSRDARRQSGELVGIGTAFYLEPSGSGWESATVTREPDNKVIVASGSSSQGHARETTFAQIAAQAFDLPAANVTVHMGDTDHAPAGIGALASRSTAIGGSAVLQACQQIKQRIKDGEPLPITVQTRYENKGQAWGYGAYLAVISICRDTGTPTLERVVCVDDAGTLVVPDFVHGQIVGGFAQGFGEAMMEQIIYDEDGQLLTGSFMDYAMPRATDVPPLEVHSFETPSPMNMLGAKGVGEAGTIGAPAAILNAALDALAPLGVTDLQMPLTSHRVWCAMQSRQKGPTT